MRVILGRKSLKQQIVLLKCITHVPLCTLVFPAGTRRYTLIEVPRGAYSPRLLNVELFDLPGVPSMNQSQIGVAKQRKGDD